MHRIARIRVVDKAAGGEILKIVMRKALRMQQGGNIFHAYVVVVAKQIRDGTYLFHERKNAEMDTFALIE